MCPDGPSDYTLAADWSFPLLLQLLLESTAGSRESGVAQVCRGGSYPLLFAGFVEPAYPAKGAGL